jgi:hypothetical protein
MILRKKIKMVRPARATRPSWRSVQARDIGSANSSVSGRM